MTNHFYIVFLSFLFFSCDGKRPVAIPDAEPIAQEQQAEERFVIVLHGGAGTIEKKNMTDSLEDAYKNKLAEAITTGYQVLQEGGTALDAVTKTINVLEDSPLFNAGRGAVFTNEGRNELDASIMDGKTLKAGAVAGVRRIKNPINLARDVMDKSPHVMLYGAGAEEFARGINYEMTDTSYFYTRKNFEILQQVKSKSKTAARSNSRDVILNDSKFGTVGCVALDKHGNLAAGTSTGGMTNKRWNRIGDSPIIGAGTYANNATCAVSATGWGEKFIRSVAAYDISALMEYKGLSLEEAAREVIQKKLPKMEGDGGVVAVDKEGNWVMEFNTAGMFRAAMTSHGEVVIGMYK